MNGGGPKSDEGKSVSRWNAAKHGLRSPAPVVPGVENKEDWEAHREGILENLSPEGHLEQVLAERVALQSWRLNRIIRYERESIVLSRERMEDDVPAVEKPGPGTDRGDLEFFRSSLEDAQHARPLLNANLKLPAEEPVSSYTAQFLISLIRVAAGQSTSTARRTNIGVVTLPGAPHPIDLDYPETFDDWNVELIRQAVDAIAGHVGESTDKLLEATRSKFEKLCREYEEKRQLLEKELNRMSRERLLPDDKTLEKIARYEAHISRQMYQALHELEALQTRRAGGSAPLGRMDVQGLPEK